MMIWYIKISLDLFCWAPHVSVLTYGLCFDSSRFLHIDLHIDFLLTLFKLYKRDRTALIPFLPCCLFLFHLDSLGLSLSVHILLYILIIYILYIYISIFLHFLCYSMVVVLIGTFCF